MRADARPRGAYIAVLLTLQAVFSGCALCARALPAQAPSVQPLRGTASRAGLIVPGANLNLVTRLSGHLPRWVTPAADRGPLDPGTPLLLTILLARPPELQAAFEKLLRDQQNPASPRYHQWLSPGEIGDQFGASTADVGAITAWLTHQGLQVSGVAGSRLFIEASGPAATVSAAFLTPIHRMAGPDGETRFSATLDPAIPTAFASVVRSVQGLTEMPFRPMHTIRQAEPRASAGSPGPLYSNKTNTTHYVFPGDFANIYDLKAATGAGYNGSGVHVAIVGVTRIHNSDVTELENLAGLPANTPNQILTPGSADPGVVPITATGGDQEESVLDVDRILTVATGAQADLVITASGSGSIGGSIKYNIETLLDPVMTISYGSCESAASAQQVAFYDSLFAQAAGEGISVFVSSGDAGAAGCSAQFTAPTGSEVREPGNFLCSSSYATCVGGTEFIDPDPGLFWAASNDVTSSGGTTYTSALGYIPEGAWNEPTSTHTVNGVSTTTYEIAGSGSGPSAFIAKPTWQSGTGVPADGARDTPDISFTAAEHDGYFACVAGAGAGYDCNQGGGAVFSGTSASAPGMAAVAALLDGRLGKAQGNLNPLLYRLAASAPGAFHDATPATSGVANCSTATASTCNNSLPGTASLTGGLAGYPLQIGYDLVTGLGSLDIANFLNAAAPVTPITVAITTGLSRTALTLSAGAATGNTSTLTVTSQSGFQGAVALSCVVAYTGGGAATFPPTCAFLPGSVAVAAGATATAVLTVSTTVPHLGEAPATHALRRVPEGLLLSFAILPLLFPFARRGAPSARTVVLTLLLGTGLLSGCGSGAGSSLPAPPPAPTLIGTSPGGYTVTVTATPDTGLAVTSSLSLTVQ